jgi:hypothetical protein
MIIIGILTNHRFRAPNPGGMHLGGKKPKFAQSASNYSQLGLIAMSAAHLCRTNTLCVGTKLG